MLLFFLTFKFILEYSAWRIPWTEEPGELQSIGSQRVRQDLSNLACTHIYNGVICSSAQQNDLVIHIHVSVLF